MLGSFNHDPEFLRIALSEHCGYVVLDVETTGLIHGRSRVLSIGVRFDGINHIIFTKNCSHSSIALQKVSDADAYDAMERLVKQPAITIVGHNLKFDLRMLHHFGLPIRNKMADTEALLRLLDQDRGPTRDQSQDGAQVDCSRARVDLASRSWDRRLLDYKLKHVVPQLLGIKPIFTPTVSMDLLSFEQHRRYLASDLVSTEKLYRYLWTHLHPQQREWWTAVGSPLSYLLMDMSELGVAADAGFVASEVERITEAMEKISVSHEQQYGVALVGLGDWSLGKLLYTTYGLPHKKAKGKWPINDKTLKRLWAVAGSKADSLALIRGFRQLQSLATRLGGYSKFVDQGRIHSSFDNRQATGRVSSSGPNLQQLAKKKDILTKKKKDPEPEDFVESRPELATSVVTRNLLLASPGYLLVSADIAQADPRVLAHDINTCNVGTNAFVHDLHERRRVDFGLARFDKILDACRNPNFNGPTADEPLPFKPHKKHQLVEDFVNPTGQDFYCQVASNVVGTTIIKDSPQRKIYKTVLLAQVNGQTPRGLTEPLGCSLQQAQQQVRAVLPSLSRHRRLSRPEEVRSRDHRPDTYMEGANSYDNRPSLDGDRAACSSAADLRKRREILV